MKIFSAGGKLHFIKNLYRRYKNGAGCCDTYSLYYYLAPIIGKGLKEFKHYNIGTPMRLSVKKWDRILDEMIWSFEWISNNDKDESKENYERFSKGIKLFSKYYLDLWW